MYILHEVHTYFVVPVSRSENFKMAAVKQINDDDENSVIKEGKHVILKWNNVLRAVLVQRNRLVALKCQTNLF